ADTARSDRTETTLSAAPGSAPGVARPTPAVERAAAVRARAAEDSIANAEIERNARDGGWGRFPGPWPLAVLVIVVLGALGALAGDLVADGTRLDRWRRDDTGWTLGFPGRLLIGVVTALIVVLGINPPNGSWPVLMSTALAVGAASEAILLAVMASWKARMAESETRRVRNAAVQKIEGMRVGMLAIHEAAAHGATAGLAAQVDRLAKQAKAELLAETVHPADVSPATPLVSSSNRKVLMRDSFDVTGFAGDDFGGAGAALAKGATGRKEVVITYKVPDTDFSELLVDDVPIAPDGEGVYRALVGPGEHVLHCRAQTRPKVEYEVEITDPEEARWKPVPPRRADSNGVINDFMTFNING
ncbi:MAG TPA: hypothetical protein VEW03_04075, partial [Longimicrobiaceae bacterium]|nr:hypothetical protein [Longimicrobiaceae bacterium]